MKKTIIFLIMLSLVCVGTTACTNQKKPKKSMVQAQRRFAKYLEGEQKNPNAIDLSEGPKQNYNANFGPNNLEFDIKIVDPY